MRRQAQLLFGAAALAALGCERDPAPAPETRDVRGERAAAPAVSSSGAAAASKPRFPPEARRDSPPEGMSAALAVGARAPELKELAAVSRAAADSGAARSQWSRSDRPTVLVFYRGHW